MRLFSFIIAFALCCACFAEELKENLKFGNPTKTEMEIEKYDSEPDAEAIVLCRLRNEQFVLLSDGFQKQVEHKVRIKVLKQEGTDYANVSCMYYSSKKNNAYKESIFDISATAYNFEDGKTVSTKMKNNLIFRERVNDDFMVVKFTVPQVKVGTVIEYSYTEQTDNVFSIDDWFAQYDIPVLFTRYTLTLPDCYVFSVENTGFVSLETKTEKGNITIAVGDGQVASISTNKYVFTGRNIPSLKDDDSVWCIDDYRTKVTCEFQATRYPLQAKSYTSTWDAIAHMLMSDDDFGGRLSGGTPLKDDIAKLGLDKMESIDDKVAAIYSLLMSKMEWNKDYTLYAYKRASAALKDGTASSADLNFMLINMLKEAGIEAWPVLVRMRHHGHLPLTHPSLKKMDTFVVAFNKGEDGWGVIDAASKSGYIDAVSPQLMTDKGLLFKKDGFDWLDLSQKCSGREVSRITAEVKPDGSIEGTRTNRYYHQYSLLFKESMKNRDSIDVEEKVGNRLEARIKDYSIEGEVEAFTPSIAEVYAFEKSGQGGGDIIYVNPFVFKMWEENPYTNEKREVPIERPIKTSEDYSVALVIPDGYDVEELPKPLNVKSPDGNISCRVMFGKEGNVVNVSYRYQVKRLFFATEEYNDLRQIYDLIYSKCNEMIALKKL